jgi:hypothetical protein
MLENIDTPAEMKQTLNEIVQSAKAKRRAGEPARRGAEMNPI